VLLATVALPLPLHHHHHRHRAPQARHRHPASPSRARAAAKSHTRNPSHRRQRHVTLNASAGGTLLATVSRSTARAHVAGDPGDVISDFKFAPATLTVHVGDTITWTNDGPSPHSATAHDGSFDTGVLKKGASASHTFTTAGTFSYFCTVHPFMHGTVVVVANTSSSSTGHTGSGSGSTSGSGSGGSTGTTPSTSQTRSGSGTSSTTPATTSSQQTLPVTGMDVRLTMVVAILLAGIGVLLRRRQRSDP
jgi:plastocyanin